MQRNTLSRLARHGALAAALLATALPARADLLTDLRSLDAQGGALRAYLSATSLTAGPACSRLVDANRMARDLVSSVAAIDAGLAAPLSVDSATLDAVDALGVTTVGLASEAMRLSLDLSSLSATVDALNLEDAIVAMLQLSDDIGTMADRIGQMADDILLMSGDIGSMADRILATQELQNQNLALTTQSLLTTQENALAVVSVVEDTSYSVDFATLVADGTDLARRMQAVALHPWTMDDEMAAVAADVRAYLAEVQGVNDRVTAGASSNTFTVTPSGLSQLADLSAVLAGFSTAIDGYVVAIGGLQAITSAPTLEQSLGSMLQLSADIGAMSNRILEMSDLMLAMSDNIGMEADLILSTQAATNSDVAAMQQSILSAQTFAVNLIAMRWL